ncbi:MAG: hypothetical protein ACRBCI_01300 [Cellvibrionaceae bacterium]
MLTNKHFIVALIITPILAIIAYFAVDYAVSERPHNAVSGNSYPLAAKSNCRYQSGKCTFKNGDIEVILTSKNHGNNTITFQLESELPLAGAKIALATASNEQAPETMSSLNDSTTQWETTIQSRDIENARLLLVVSLNEALYYGETETTFTHYQTGFSHANMQ